MSESSSQGGSVQIVKVVAGWVVVLRRMVAGAVSWEVEMVGDPAAAEVLDRHGFRTFASAERYAVRAAGNTIGGAT